MELSYYKSMEPFWGTWRIKKMIGEGSFGKVFEIEREDFGRTYNAAMKVITIPQSESEFKSILADGMDLQSATSYYKGFVEEVVDEFALMANLKGNSNIVSYEDHTVIEHKDGVGWDILIRMELLTPLLDYTSTERPMGREDVIRLGVDICKALEYCRKQNIIHRDIKPENIFVSPVGDYKLGDFGIARTVEKTTSGLSRKGTYTYMAPEVYRGENYDATVDIYSLGIVLYRLLNRNRTPFLPDFPEPITHSDRENSIARRIGGEPLPLPLEAKDELGKIVLKACAYLPKDRYISPQDMRRDLEALQMAQAAPSFHAGAVLAQKTASEDMTIPQQPLPEDATVRGQSMMEDMTVREKTVQEDMTVREKTVPEDVTVRDQSSQEEDATVSMFGSTSGKEPSWPEKKEKTADEEDWRWSAEEEDATVSLFGDTEDGEMPKETAGKSRDMAGNNERQKKTPDKTKPKKNKFLLLGGIGAAVVVLAAVVFFLGMGGGTAPTVSEDYSAPAAVSDETGESVADSKIALSNATLYGNYCTEYIGPRSADPFMEGMDYAKINEEEVSVLPIQTYFFPEGSLYAGGNDSSVYQAILGDEKSGYCSNMELGLSNEDLFLHVATGLCGDGVAGQAISFYEENIKDKMDSAEMYFVDKDGKDVCVDGYYKVDGSVMDFGYLTVDGEGNLGMETLQFDISFSGKDLQISRDGISRTIPPFDFRESITNKGISGYASSGKDAYMGISVIFLSGVMSDSSHKYISIEYEDGYGAVDPVIELSGENAVTISWEKKGIPSGLSFINVEEDIVTMTFQYLSCGPIGFVLLADGESYFYQSTREEYYERRLQDSLMGAEYSDLEDMEDESLKEMVLTQGKIMEDLKTAFEEAAMEVDIDEQSGKITMRNNILFGLDEAELSEDGKGDLDYFFEIYESVILNEDSEYYDYIEAILLEGHTDSSGDYDYNKELSLERAIAVDDYCYEKYPALSNYIDTEGCASDNLIYDENGEEDSEASRRVVFKVILDLDAF